MKCFVRTTVFRLIPILAASVAAQAGTMSYTFGASAPGFTCAGTESSCSGSGAGTVVPPSGAVLYTTPSESDSVGSIGDRAALNWSGTGTGIAPLLIPMSWDFSITTTGSASSVSWDLQFTLDGTTLYDSTFQALGSNPVIGFTEISTAALGVNPTMGAWDVDLQVNYAVGAGSGGVTITVPAGTSIDLGSSAVPEPASWGLAASGLWFAVVSMRRKLRRR